MSNLDEKSNFRSLFPFDIFVGAIGILMNVFLMGLILWKPRKLRKSRNLIFLLNLAFSDVALSAFLASFNAVKHVHDPNYLDEIICPLEGILNQVVGINALMSVMLLALDRYMIVVKKITIRTRYCLLSILVVTIISIIAGLSPWLIDKNAFVVQPSGNYCLLDLSKTNPRLQGIENAPAVAYGTALLITLCCYFFIIVEIRSVSAGIRRFQSKKLMDSQPELANGSQVLKTTETQELSSTLQIWRSQHGIAEKKSVKNWAAKFFSTLGPKNSQPPSTTLSNVESKIEKAFPAPSKKRRSFEILLAKKTILIGGTHFLAYFPFAVCCLMQLYKHKNLGTLDIISVHFIIFCPLLDAMWSFLLDPQIKKKMRELKELFFKKE